MATNSSTCVGRDYELNDLDNRFRKALTDRASVCLVKGETGSGKSTLLRQFVSTIENDATNPVIAWGHCDQQSGSIHPLLPWIGILQSLSGSEGISIPEEALHDSGGVMASVQSAIQELAPDLIELLLPGIGLVYRSAKLISNRTGLSKRLLRRESTETSHLVADKYQLHDQYVAVIEQVLDKAPMVLVIDDYHCIDDASLALLHRIAAKVTSRPMLLVIAMRDVELSNPVAKSALKLCNQLGSTVIDLDESRKIRGPELVVEYASEVVPGVSEKFTESLVRHTGGHPLFVVELVNHLIAHQQIVQTGSAWQEARDIDWEEVPARIDVVLSEQLDEVEEDVRHLLQLASVEGDRFTVEVLAALEGKTPIEIARVLSRKAPANLIEPLGSFKLGNNRVTRFRFRHSLARVHTYESINPGELIYLHEAIGNEIESLAENSTDSVAGELALQFELAEVHAKAGQYHQQAAMVAISSCALTEAIVHLEKALTILGKADTSNDEETKLGLICQLGELKHTVGQFEESKLLLTEALVLARSIDHVSLPQVLVGLASATLRLGELEAAEGFASESESISRLTDNQPGLLAALGVLAAIVEPQNNKRDSLKYTSEAADIARGIADDLALIRSLSRHGWFLKENGMYEEAQKVFDEALGLCEQESPDYDLLASLHNGCADLWMSLEDYERARMHMELTISYWQKYDRIADAAIGLNNLANLCNREQAYDDALRFARESLEAELVYVGMDHPNVAFPLTCIGESLIGLGDHAEALGPLEQALSIRDNHNVAIGNVAWTRWLLGRALVESGQDTSRGMALVNKARLQLTGMGQAAESEVKDIEHWLQQN